ncbi:hypothetical protein [Streptomyces sp. SPB162]|uniref:hypothetical protein n=1 Tax=Streptomyces sp. SPB162 TaxID=2940560 RepID=UPI0024062438|nr:hypothetical protein [Streptomyces sp. SPB162]
MSQNPGREPGHDPRSDGRGARPEPQPPRSATLRFLSPGPDTSTTQLKVYAGIWAVLLVLWISAQFWTSDISGFQRMLYALLALVALTQVSSAATRLRRRR